MKTTRICARKGCTNEFKLYKSTDKYCSGECAYLSQKAKPKKKPKAIKPYSEKRKRESYLYTKKRNVFMKKPENKYCPVCKAAFEGLIDINELEHDWFKALLIRSEGLIETTECHHKAGRKGKLLVYVPYFLAVSTVGHRWIHTHPEQAYKLGFLIRSTTINI